MAVIPQELKTLFTSALVLAHATKLGLIVQTDACTCMVGINQSQEVTDKESDRDLLLFWNTALERVGHLEEE